MSSTTRSTTRSSDKPFSLVIFGATGFTGQLITSRLLQNEEVSAKKLKILLAGRSDTKLKQLVKGDEKNAHLVDFCVTSVDDDESLDKMTAQSKVILNCVGPFSKYGEAVVQSCLRNHCHYLDITGEPAYIQTLISKYDEVARLKKICLVCSCGFDSIPADIGVFNVLKQVSLFNDLDDDKNTGFVAVNGYLKLNMPGLISYGTYHTVVTSLDNLSLFGSGKNTKQQKTNENKKQKKKSILKRGIRWEPSVNSYVVPFSTSDPTIVKRSAEVLGYMNDGAIPFEYGHYLQIQKWYNILLLLVVMLFLLLVTRFSWGAKLLLKLWRQPGEGPSEEDRKKSSCELTFEGIATHEKTIQTVTGACVIAGDPGYDETAHMALQSALLMNELYGEEDVNESERRYGVLTPAPVFGQQIVDRLHDNSKVRFIVKENKTIKNTDPSYVEVRREVERLTNIKNFE